MTRSFAFRIVDVFSDRPLAGNALCVVLDPAPEDAMQPIAREVNLSETTFPTVTGTSDYEMRIFTPGMELDFAGHPSLGTAWCLGPARWTQRTRGATVVIEADEQGATMTQPDPVLAETDPGPAVAAARLPGAEAVWTASAGGTTHTILLTESPIDALAPDLGAVLDVSRANGTVTFAVVRRLDDRTLHVRNFPVAAGVNEDPGTGSAAGPIGLLARRHWGTDADLTIHQGREIGRPCTIEVHAEEGHIRVGGRVAACAEGHFSL